MRSTVRVALFSGAAIVLTACGGGETGERTRNTALNARWTMPYSCAQLLTDQATTDTTAIRFKLCAEAETYSIVTPSGVNGSVNEASTTGVKEVVVPISPEVDGPTTRLVVSVAGAAADDPYHPGIHIYEVSLSRATEELVGAESPLIDVVYPKVRYDMPLPQTFSTYREGPFGLDDARTTYSSYVEELGQKWAMVRYTTCHPNVAHAMMAHVDPGNASGAASHAQSAAKRVRSRPWFVALDSLRVFIALAGNEVNICPAGARGVNVFTQGVEAGFVPIDRTQVATSTDSTQLLRSFALVRYWEQVVRKQCPADRAVTATEREANNLRVWSIALYDRLVALADDTSQSQSEQRSARRAADQATMLGILQDVRLASGATNLCTVIPAGYAVPVQRPQVEIQEQAAVTLPPAVEPQSQGSASESPDTSVPATDMSAPQSELSWSAAASTAPLRLRVGQSASRAELLARSGLLVNPGSRVTVRPLAASTRVCASSSWGVKARRVGTCRVRVTVTTKGKKTQVKTVSLRVVK